VGRAQTGIRLSNSHDCHALSGLIDGAAGSGSGEGYGATLYYSTACSVQGLRISGCRHSILFQGTTFCSAIGNTSTDDLMSAIDTHGTNCLDTVIAASLRQITPRSLGQQPRCTPHAPGLCKKISE